MRGDTLLDEIHLVAKLRRTHSSRWCQQKGAFVLYVRITKAEGRGKMHDNATGIEQGPMETRNTGRAGGQVTNLQAWQGKV